MAVNEFEDWLCKKLMSLDIDNDVYGSYITGILLDTDDEEKHIAILEVFNSLEVNNIDDLCKDVVEAWKTFQFNKPQTIESSESAKSIGDIFAAHTPASTKKTLKAKQDGSTDTSAVKRVVLARYGEIKDEEENGNILQADANLPSHCNTVDSALEIMKNTNAESITQAEKLERQKRKEEAMKKKEQDKTNRENQKTKKAERKEKEKKRTQKKERGR